MTPAISPCLGGFCGLRDKCEHHTNPTTRRRPAERLCDPGVEREMFFKREKSNEEKQYEQDPGLAI